MDDPPPILNIDDVAFIETKHGDQFEAKLGAVATPLGATLLGARMTIVPPGKRAFPFHSHHGNEEMFVVFDGKGELRLGDARYPLKPGDVAVCPPGGAETAHQIINTGDVDLRYLAISTMNHPEVLEYPDSGKWGMMAGSGPGGDARKRTVTAYVRQEAAVDYFDREDSGTT